MKKKLFIAAVCLLVLLLSFIIFLQYRQYQAFRVPIHAQAQTVWKIHTDEIIRELIFNYGTRYRKKIDRGEDKPDSASKNTGIYFPAHIFVYNIISKHSSTYFTCLPIHNANDFKKYMQSRFSFSVAEETTVYRGVSGDDKIKFLGNTDFVVFAYSPKEEAVDSAMRDILFSKKVLDRESPLLKKLKQQQSEISLAGSGFQARFSIEGKDIQMNAEIDIINRVLIPNEKFTQPLSEGMFAVLSLNAIPPAKSLQPMYEIEGHPIERDSVLQYLKGFMSLQLGHNSQQTDTIISYEYDDNFEMQAVTQTQVQWVPSIQLTLAADGNALYRYLQRQSFIDEAGNFNREIFPLYPVSVQSNRDYIFFSTENQSEIPQTKLGDDILNLQILAKEIDSTGLYAFLQPYNQGLTQLNLKATHSKNSIIHITGKLHFDSKAIDVLMEWMNKKD